MVQILPMTETLADVIADMRRTAAELRANSNGDCNAAMQAIMWDKKAAALEAADKARTSPETATSEDLK